MGEGKEVKNQLIEQEKVKDNYEIIKSSQYI
jgi:hypothetical protein